MSSKPNLVIYHNSSFEGDSLDTRPLGGTETSEIYLSREFAKQGLNIAIFCNCSKPGTYNGVEFRNINEFKSFNNTTGSKVFISQTNPMIFNETINAGLKVFWSAGSYSVRANQPLKDKAIRSKIDRYICLSNWQAETYSKHFNIEKNRIFITRNGINPVLFGDPSIKREKYRLIYSSEPTRGLDVLLDIFPKVRKDFPQLTLYIFSDYEFYGKAKGSAFSDEGCKPIFERTKQPGIFNMGNIKQKDLATEFMKSYVLAYPTHFEETSCISAIEAQAAGVPVLTTRLAALSETVADNVTGKLISGNSRSWFYKLKFIKELKRLLSDEKYWQALSNNGIERVKRHYSWEQIAKEWLQEFKTFL